MIAGAGVLLALVAFVAGLCVGIGAGYREGVREGARRVAGKFTPRELARADRRSVKRVRRKWGRQ